MPSLMPGTPGAKEVYAIAVIREDLTVAIPPEAHKRFEVREGDLVLLATSHVGEAGFSLISSRKAQGTRLESLLRGVGEDKVIWSGKKARTMVRVSKGRIRLSPDALGAYGIRSGARLLVIKGAAAGMAYVPVEVWIEKLTRRGLYEPVANIERLKEI